MYQAFVDAPGKSRNMLSDFGGLNQTEACAPNEFRDMMNLSSDAYPYLTQRAARPFEAAPLVSDEHESELYFHNGPWIEGGDVLGDMMFSDTVPVVPGVNYYCNFKYGEGMLKMPSCYEVTLYPGKNKLDGVTQSFEDGTFDFDVPKGYFYAVISVMGEEGWFDYVGIHSTFIDPKLSAKNFMASTIHDGKLAAVFRDKLYLDGACVINGISSYTTVHGYECSLLSYGAELIVMPHGVAYNTITQETRSLGAKIALHYSTWPYIHPAELILSPCDADGNQIVASTEKPSDPTNGQYWLDTSETPNKLYRWSESSESWVGISTTYVKLKFTLGESYDESYSYADAAHEVYEATKIFENNFKVGDGVKFEYGDHSFLKVFEEDTYHVIQKIGYDEEEMIEGNRSIKARLPYLVFAGVATEALTLGVLGFEIIRDIPVLEHYTVSKNRIWGCISDGEVNEIRCCKLGDPTNWNVFAGASTDSYTVSIGTPGAFTGAVTYEGEPYFFKENAIMKLYGDYPASYQLYTYSCEGVQQGSARSLCTSGGHLYFKSPNDFCVFDGARPQSISYKLGFEKYKNVVAGAVGSKLYFSCLDHTGESVLLVYDRNVGAWYREADARYLDFCQDHAGHMYGITNEHTVTFEKAAAGEGEELEWFAETGLIGVDQPDQKTVSRYTLRAEQEPGARLTLLAAYDDGDFEELYTCLGEGRLQSHTFSVRPVRCDHLRLRLEGEGRCTVYSIAYSMEQRSDKP